MTKPKIRAQFELDEDGNPKALSEGGVSHYRIRLSVEGAPADANAVVYHLPEDFYNPIREVRQGPEFPQSITSYSDVALRAQIRGRRSVESTGVELVRALKSVYGQSPNEKIQAALKALEEH